MSSGDGSGVGENGDLRYILEIEVTSLANECDIQQASDMSNPAGEAFAFSNQYLLSTSPKSVRTEEGNQVSIPLVSHSGRHPSLYHLPLTPASPLARFGSLARY